MNLHGNSEALVFDSPRLEVQSRVYLIDFHTFSLPLVVRTHILWMMTAAPGEISVQWLADLILIYFTQKIHQADNIFSD